MSYSRQMLDTYPGTFGVDAAVLAAAIDALGDCAQACTADVDADLSEQNLAEMVRCIRLCLDCVDVCTATLGVTSRQADYDADVTKPLRRACVAMHQLRRRVRAACPALPALPGLRAGLPRAPGRPEIAHRPLRRALAYPTALTDSLIVTTLGIRRGCWPSPTPKGSRLEGFRAGYSGLPREAFAPDLRQFTSWCRAALCPCPPRAAGWRPWGQDGGAKNSRAIPSGSRKETPEP
jgi:ferredoxin